MSVTGDAAEKVIDSVGSALGSLSVIFAVENSRISATIFLLQKNDR
jgi:hypothetical protein